MIFINQYNYLKTFFQIPNLTLLSTSVLPNLTLLSTSVLPNLTLLVTKPHFITSYPQRKSLVIRQLFANFFLYKCYQVIFENTQEFVVQKSGLKKRFLG